MVDYYALISPTIEPLAEAPPEERKLVYERLVAMLDQQLRAADPPRSDKDILKERIQLETAIRRVERHILARRPPIRTKPEQSTSDTQKPETQSAAPLSLETESLKTSEPKIAAPEIDVPAIAAPEIIIQEIEAREIETPEITTPEIVAQDIETPEPFNDPAIDEPPSTSPSKDEGDARAEAVPEMPKISESAAALVHQEAQDHSQEFEPTKSQDGVQSERRSDAIEPAHADLPLPTVAIKKSLFEDRSRPVGPRDIFSRRLPVATEDHSADATEPEHDLEAPKSAPHTEEEQSSPLATEPAAANTMSATRTDIVPVAPAPFYIDETAKEQNAPPFEEARAFTPTANVVITRDRIVSDQRKGLVLRLSILILVLLALGAAVAAVSEFLARRTIEASTSKQGDVALSNATPEAKFTDRLPVEPDEPLKSTAGTGAGATNPSSNANADNALLIQRALFIEEPAGGIGEAKRTEGRVIWKLETLKSTLSGAADLGVKASIDLADAGLSASFVFRKNRDTTSVNAHLIEVSFQPSADNVNGKIRDISLPELRVDERTRGVTLAGIPVPVSDNVFLIGLNALPADAQRNIDLLRSRNWFFLPLRYGTGKRALLLFEKGKPGERIFEDAIQAWK